MRTPVRSFRLVVVLSTLLSSFVAATPALAQLEPPSFNEDPNEFSREREREAAVGNYDVRDQALLLERALDYYRGIQERGGWRKVSTDVVMGPGYPYDCRRIIELERRMVAEGYMRRVNTIPPPPPPAPEPGWRRKPQPVKPHEPTCLYSRELAAAVQNFQNDRKVLGNGQVGKLTFAELNKPVEEIINALRHDVERMRRVPLERSGTFILVNIPFFEMRLYENGREALRMPVVVGKKDWPTPLLNDEIEYLIVNPDWGIPDRIAKLEYWPSAKRNPKWLANQGISATGGSLRQKPGPRNPLGRIKFMLPNEHDVYLHDTPEKGAFKAAVRALSHGCVRLSQPMDLANYLLRDDPSWSPERLQKAIASGKTMQINLAQHMPVHIIYSTTRVNEEGRLEVRADVYGRNGRRLSPEEEAEARNVRGEYREGP